MTHPEKVEKSGSYDIDRTSVRDRSEVPLALFLAVGAAMGFDVGADLLEGASLGHVSLELFILALASAGAFLLWRRWLSERRSRQEAEVALVRSREDLARSREEAARWRDEAKDSLRGLSDAIDLQFDRWSLTQAEREVGLLLLKGLAFKEIADVRSTTERTVRQQANHLYKKAGLAGRAELSAFFLEDLLLPRSTDQG